MTKDKSEYFKEKMTETGVKVAVNFVTELGKMATKKIINKISDAIDNKDNTFTILTTNTDKPIGKSKNGKPAKFSNILFNPNRAEKKLAKAGEKWAKEGRRLNDLRKDLETKKDIISKSKEIKPKDTTKCFNINAKCRKTK